MSFIEFKHIGKKYAGAEHKSVDDFNLNIEEKEFIAFVGPSGCGKSTTLRMIAGFEEITEGDLYIDGKRVNETAPRDRGIAMVFQNYALYPLCYSAGRFVPTYDRRKKYRIRAEEHEDASRPNQEKSRLGN